MYGVNYFDPFNGAVLLEAKAKSFKMTIKDYYSASHQHSIKLRVTVLTAIKIYQEMTEQTPPFTFPIFELIEGHFDGPRAYHKITAFELWREICMWL